MNDLQIFENAEFGSIRTIEQNNKILFCGKDVAKALNYDQPHKAIERHCKYGMKCTVPHPQSASKTIEMIFIPEGDVYRLIAHSKLPTAEKFESWVFDEVLPSIRKHGVYAVDDVLNNPDVWITALQELKAEREKTKQLTETVAVQTQQIAEMQPKVSYYDLVLNCKDLISISVIAKDYGKSAKWLNNFLHEHKVQYKQGKIWLLNQKYAENGYTSTKTHTVNGKDGEIHPKVHTYWTQKGRLFIYDLLKSNGVLPLIEREEKVA